VQVLSATSKTSGLTAAPQLSARATRSVMPWLLLWGALFYNAGLAFLNGHGIRLSEFHVALTEIFVLMCAALFLLFRWNKLGPKRAFVITSFGVFMFLFAWVTVTNGILFVRTPREFAIICIFYLVGTQCPPEKMLKAFRLIVIATIAVLLIEGFAVPLYVWLFQPADYFANTRGIEKFALDDSGLFRNSLGFAGRFTFGLFGTRRLSSLFLEQVSLANFAMVLCIFTVTWWPQMRRGDRLLFAGAVILMILSNSSRTGTALCLLMALGYYICPKLPRSLYGVAMPALLIVAALLFYNPDQGLGFEDTMSGRIGHTISLLARMDLADLVTGDLGSVGMTGDSGYAYLVYATTAIGLIYFWIFLWVVLPGDSAMDKRFAFCTLLFICVNLTVGAAILSIKVSAPLWLICGCLCARADALRAQKPPPKPLFTQVGVK